MNYAPQPLVSLLILSYNREAYLDQAIASVLAQTYRNFELLIWDDGSTDRSLKIARAYARRDSRVRVVAAPHQGIPISRVQAIAQLQGKYLGWVDSDDWLAPTALEQTVQVLEVQPDIGMVYTDHWVTDAAGTVHGLGRRCQIPYSKERLLLDFVTFHFRLIRRSVYDQVGGIDQSCQRVYDYDLCLRLSETTEIYHLDEPLYFYRYHETSRSNLWRREQILWTHRILNRALHRRGLSDRYRIDVRLEETDCELLGYFSLVKFNPTMIPAPPQGEAFRLPIRLPNRLPNSVLLPPLSSTPHTPHPTPHTHPLTKAASLLFTLPLVTLLALPGLADPVPAQDGTGTRIERVGDRFDITGGQRSRDGQNLFHSFEQFGLTQNQIANFLADPQLSAIFGRVTGGDASIINGILQITGGSPDLYLLNPAGIVFGPDAQLNLPAAFTATTATGIGFDNGWFNAIGDNSYADLVGSPSSFAFGLSQPGAIINAGDLAVGAGQSLTLLGGTIVNTGTLSAPGGNITVTAVPGENLVRLSQDGSLLSVEFTPLGVDRPNATTLTPALLPQLLTGGDIPDATGLTVDPDGTVRLSSSSVIIPPDPGTTVISGTLSTTPTELTEPTTPTSQITLLGDRIALTEANINADNASGGGIIRIGGDYQGGDTLPTADLTVIDAGTTISADALDSGDGGTVIVWADGTTRFWGNISATGGLNLGDGGFVEVSGRDTLVFDGLVDTSAPNGELGTLLLDPLNITIVDSFPAADDGEITDGQILASDRPGDNLTISTSALFSASSTGNVLLEATNNITVAPGVSMIFSSIGGRDIRFTADQDGDGVGDFTMDPTTTIEAPASNLFISGANLTLGNLSTETFGPLPSGNITLESTGDIAVEDVSTADPTTFFGYGTGNIRIITTGGSITTGNLDASATEFIEAGDITLEATEDITALTIDASAANGYGGGEVRIISSQGDVTASSIDTRTDIGDGGPVTISGDLVRITDTITVPILGDFSIITTSTDANGPVTITHAGGPNNFAFGVADPFLSGINGTAGPILADASPLSGTFDMTTTTVTSLNVTINARNSAPQINNANLQYSTTESTSVNIPFTSIFSNPSTDLTDPDNDIIFVRIANIASGGTVTRNGLVLAAGDVISSGDVLVYTPADGTTGLVGAFSVVAVDPRNSSPELARSPAVTVQVDVTPTPTPIPTPEPTPTPTPEPTPTPTPTPEPTPTPTPEPTPTPTPDRQVLSERDLPEDPRIELTYAPVEPPIAFVPSTTIDLTIINLEDSYTSDFSDYLEIARPPLLSLDEASDILQEIEDATGEKPALIYVHFIPPGLSSPVIPTDPQDTDQLELVVVTANGIFRRRVPVTRSEFMAVAAEFRSNVTNPRFINTDSYLPFAQQLYQWIIAPLEADLQAQEITNLVFLPDAGLRSLPFAALHNGEQFLIEQYSTGLMPSLSLTDTRYVDIRDSQILAIGVSESTQGQIPLPAVPLELSTVMMESWRGGKIFLNQEATLENLRQIRQEQPFGVIHLATHADFLPGPSGNSYIQFWNEQLHMDEIRQLGWNDPPVHMLVLSACRTALGSDEAELGFAGLAVQTGVQSVVASLWYVSDLGTAALMPEFYEILGSAPIKAEALRQAQVAMAQGQIRIVDGQIQGLTGIGALPLPAGTPNPGDSDLSHPYYWSAFTLVGNPW
jgi:filamentous hemagglutinin family protein